MSQSKLQAFMEKLKSRNPHEAEFHQAVKEVIETSLPYIEQHKAYQGHGLLERLCEPDRVVSFRVAWLDDE